MTKSKSSKLKDIQKNEKRNLIKSGYINKDGCLNDAIKTNEICLRKTGPCCQAICLNGKHCQNIGKYTIDVSAISKIPFMKWNVVDQVCRAINLHPTELTECCKICKRHLQAATLRFIAKIGNKCFEYYIGAFTDQIKLILFPEYDIEFSALDFIDESLTI